MVNHCTAFNDRYKMFFYFLSIKNKIIVFIPTPSNSEFAAESLLQCFKCFFTVLSHNNARLENGQSEVLKRLQKHPLC